MSAESVLYGWLSGHAALTELVSTRIYPDVIAQGEALPAVAYTRSGTEPVSVIHGAAAAEFVTLQIQCWAATRTAADAVADAVQAALAANGEDRLARGTLFDEETGSFGTALDVRLLVNT